MNKRVNQSILQILVAFVIVWTGHAAIEAVFMPEHGFFRWFITDVPVADVVLRFFILIVITVVALMKLPGKINLDVIDINIPEELLEEDEFGNIAFKRFIHTLRTHLNNIVGFTNLLHEKGLDDNTSKTYVSYLQISKNALNTAIDNLIASYQKVSKKSSGKQWEYIKDINWSGKQILIVEDNPMNYTMLRNILDKTQVEILWAHNGQEAIDMVKQHSSLNLVLMDIIMPVMDGFEATLEIKKINPELPVIAQTAHSIENEKETMKQYGLSGFLMKPIWHYELILKASKYLDDEKRD